MNHLLLTELNYQKSRILGVTWVIPGFYLYTMVSQSQSWYLLPTIMTIAIAVQLTIEQNFEKRIRRLSLLPISPKQIAKRCLLVIGVPWLGFHVLFFIFYVAATRSFLTWNQGGLEIFTFTGLFLLGISLYFFQRDFISFSLNSEERIGVDALVLIGIIALIVYGLPIAYYFLLRRKMVSSWTLIAGVDVLGLILIFLTIPSFKRRRTFLE